MFLPNRKDIQGAANTASYRERRRWHAREAKLFGLKSFTPIRKAKAIRRDVELVKPSLIVRANQVIAPDVTSACGALRIHRVVGS